MKFTRGFKASMMSITGSQKPGVSDTRAFELPSASQWIWLTLHTTKDAQTNIHKPGVSDTPGL